MKIAIDPGHNCPPDTGASGVRKEDELTIEVAEKVISRLEERGHQVLNVLPKSSSSVSSSLYQRCNAANRWKADIFCSIHFNAFNGNAFGTEVFYISSTGRRIAQNIVREIASFGFYNRGAKRSNFYVLRATTMPAVLVECCFCDSTRDMNLYNPDDMARAIVDGLVGSQSVFSREPEESGVLIVEKPTTLKSFTFPFNGSPEGGEVERNPIREATIPPGEYAFNSLLIEEGHYCVELVDRYKGFEVGYIPLDDAIIKS